jgi:hypothetical protein
MANSNNAIIGYIISGLVTISGGFFAYEVVANSDWTFAPEWNMFKSILLMPLYIIGLILMFANWNKFSFSQDTYIKTTYSDGSSKTEKSNDIIDFMFGHILLPIIGRLIIAPLIIAAFIYYPLMCIVWLVGAIFPYVLAAIVLGIIILSWALGNMFQLNNQGIVLAIAGILFTAGFAYGGYAIEQGVPPTFEQQPVSTSSQNAGDCQVTESEFEDSEINEDEFE